ncbi:DUF3311 domain-containing protein [Microlunatus sp. Gsoil 973]|uniref:DUF3311 domain-containing protein n=1 Tax=Microlunatus sp. Gsoil 973 TaxID=2672569 RepID=UPI0012B4BE67|nr:DUF3311 domain-containing protein [Microlunatus sp. Gsoil 973]QGN32276.1 DUF3311 domain-containing protein [Microlunatus sp. Gsoil 973]
MGIDDVPDPESADGDPRWRLTPTKILATVILLVAIVVPLLTWTYARDTPRLFGFPFFYWYQFLWVFLAAGACYLAYLLLRREARDYRNGRHDTVNPPTGPPPDEAPDDAPGDATDDALADDASHRHGKAE